MGTRIFGTGAAQLLGKDCIVSFLRLWHTILLIVLVDQLLIVTTVVNLPVLKRGHGGRLAGHVRSTLEKLTVASHVAHTSV